jgi:outer membrane protein OmpA-like peptidoglycan-associated protein
MRRSSWILTFVLGFVPVSGVACAPVPRPTVLGEVDRARAAPAAEDAKTFAPQAYLYAEKLRADAEKAQKGGDRTGAQILAEHALAAYAHASALSRLAKATERLERASARVAATTEQATKLDENQRRVAAEADDIEGRLRVARDALPLTPSEPASAERERARFTAARSLAVEARLLCVATQMLVPDTKEVTQAFESLRALDEELAKKPARAPIDTAVKLRSTCLAELTRARRPATLRAPEEGAPDALLDELSRAGSEPRRDERGVVVILRDLFKSKTLTAPATDALTRLGQVARAHASFPVLVVVHARRGTSAADATQQGEAIAKQLATSGAARVKVELAGDALPIAAPQQKDAIPRNDRVEIVFVAPSH